MWSLRCVQVVSCAKGHDVASAQFTNVDERPAAPTETLAAKTFDQKVSRQASVFAASTAAWASPELKFGKDLRIPVDAALQCNTNDVAIQSAREGWGLTRVLNFQIDPALVAGELQIVLSEFEEPPLPIHLLHPEGRHAPAKIRAFVNMAAKRLRESRLLN